MRESDSCGVVKSHECSRSVEGRHRKSSCGPRTQTAIAELVPAGSRGAEYRPSSSRRGAALRASRCQAFALRSPDVKKICTSKDAGGTVSSGRAAGSCDAMFPGNSLALCGGWGRLGRTGEPARQSRLGMGSRGEGEPNERASEEGAHVARRIRRRTLGRAIREDPSGESGWGIRDLSTTGAFLETKARLEVGAEFDLSLIFGTAVVHVVARVVRIQEPSWQHVGGAGIQFIRLSKGTEAFLESYIESSEGEYL